jgi:hypothetical protein
VLKWISGKLTHNPHKLPLILALLLDKPDVQELNVETMLLETDITEFVTKMVVISMLTELVTKPSLGQEAVLLSIQLNQLLL